MCGIGGILALDGELSTGDPSALRRMSDSVAHRGLDDEGYALVARRSSLELWHRHVIRGQALRPGGRSE